MEAVTYFELVNENFNRRIQAGARDMLRCFFHDDLEVVRELDAKVEDFLHKAVA